MLLSSGTRLLKHIDPRQDDTSVVRGDKNIFDQGKECLKGV